MAYIVGADRYQTRMVTLRRKIKKPYRSFRKRKAADSLGKCRLSSGNNRVGGRYQTRMVTTSLDDLISKDNSVRYVESLNLENLGFIEYSGRNRGQSPYRRSDLLKLHMILSSNDSILSPIRFISLSFFSISSLSLAIVLLALFSSFC